VESGEGIESQGVLSIQQAPSVVVESGEGIESLESFRVLAGEKFCCGIR